jgi:hypothetical protein
LAAALATLRSVLRNFISLLYCWSVTIASLSKRPLTKLQSESAAMVP